MSYYLVSGLECLTGIITGPVDGPFILVILGPAPGQDALNTAMEEAGFQPVTSEKTERTAFGTKNREGEGSTHQCNGLLRHSGSYIASAEDHDRLVTVLQLKEAVWGIGVRPPIPVFCKQLFAELASLAATSPRGGGQSHGQSPQEACSWVLVEDRDWHRAKAMLVVDIVARERQLASVTQEGPDMVHITTTSTTDKAPASLPTVEALSTSLSWVAEDEEERQWLSRVGLACRRLRHRQDALHTHAQHSTGEGAGGTPGGFKPWPSVEEGLRVLEFFSGIGGMRLALPSMVRGVPIRHVTAFDCSPAPLQVYKHNFPDSEGGDEGARLDGMDGQLRDMLIDGLKLADVDGQADIWTMSPPCQPYTTTRLARRLDSKDNRARPLSHLLGLLRHMQERPRYIVLENVKGFVGSEMLCEVKATLSLCGYRWRQLLLSPIEAAALPNHRMRFYLIAQHRESPSASESSVSEAKDWDPDLIHHHFPPRIRSRYAAEPPPLSAFLLPQLPPPVLAQLLLPQSLLAKPWAKQLSIVSEYDRSTYCFSKGYSRVLDRSTGSCLLMHVPGPLADPQYAIDRTQPLSQYYGRLRRLDPDEILALSGFPPGFSWPPTVSYEKRWACIGNSINVAVVQGVMACLFEEDAFD